MNLDQTFYITLKIKSATGELIDALEDEVRLTSVENEEQLKRLQKQAFSILRRMIDQTQTRVLI